MKKTKVIRLLLSIGLLMVTVPQLLKDYFTVPDFFRGLAGGIGIGLMIMALVLQGRFKKSCCVEAEEGKAA